MLFSSGDSQGGPKNFIKMPWLRSLFDRFGLSVDYIAR
jgi:hypothetical protein